MRSTLSLPAGLAAVILLACNTAVNAHTWVEEARLIASNGSYVGAPGYIRGFAPRLPGVDPSINQNLLPPNGRANSFLATDLMCKSTQLKGKQTKDYPALTAAPGDQVALRYLENGHVTLFKTNLGKPAGRGTVYIYGTKESLDTDTYLGVHRVWNAEGTGGDKRGKLIATRPYDDGRCFQRNGEALSAERAAKVGFTDQDGSDLLCQNDIQIPTDAGTSGSYTLYWVWEWPTLDANGAVVTNESYTSCMDISMTSNAVAAVGKFSAQKSTGKAANAVGVEAQIGGPQFLMDPTAAPSLTSDNLPTGTPNGKPAPAVGGAEPNSPATTSQAVPSTSSQAPAPTSQAVAPTSQVAGGMITVTVSTKEITTVTVTQEGPAKTLTNDVPATQSTAQNASKSSALTSTAIPTPTPFLSSTSQVQQGAVSAPAQKRKRTLRVRGRAVEN